MSKWCTYIDSSAVGLCAWIDCRQSLTQWVIWFCAKHFFPSAINNVELPSHNHFVAKIYFHVFISVGVQCGLKHECVMCIYRSSTIEITLNFNCMYFTIFNLNRAIYGAERKKIATTNDFDRSVFDFIILLNFILELDRLTHF